MTLSGPSKLASHSFRGLLCDLNILGRFFQISFFALFFDSFYFNSEMCIKCVLVFVSALFPPSIFSFERSLCIPLLFWWIFSPQSLSLLLFNFSPSSLYNLASAKMSKKRNWYKGKNDPAKKLKEVFFLRKTIITPRLGVALNNVQLTKFWIY